MPAEAKASNELLRLLRLALVVSLTVALLGRSAVAGAAPIGFDETTFEAHRIAGDRAVIVPADGGPVYDSMQVIVTVSPAGSVTSARLSSLHGGGAGEAAALVAARTWRFRPFIFRGRSVEAQGPIWINTRASEVWNDAQAEFPSDDRASLHIRLAHHGFRSADYTMSLDGEGNVLFEGPERSGVDDRYVEPPAGRIPYDILIPGVHRSRLGPAEIDALVDRFRAAHFFALRPDYSAGLSEGTADTLSFSMGGRSLTVRDFGGDEIGRPDALRELREAVLELSGANHWIVGGPGSVAALLAEGVDLNEATAAELAVRAAMSYPSAEALVVDLVEAGLALERPFASRETGDSPRPMGEVLVQLAAERGEARLFAALAARGWVARVPRDLLSHAFAYGGGGCSPEFARTLVAAGADPRGRSTSYDTNATALISAMEPRGMCARAAQLPLLEALVTLGVDLNARDSERRNALYEVENAELLDRLLALGIRAHVGDRYGMSPALAAYSERAILTLLDAGADPRGTDQHHRTLRQRATDDDMPTLLAWLDAHDVP